MLKQRQLCAEQVAKALFEAEAAIDLALSKTAGLTSLMPAVRAQAGLSALMGQDALERSTHAVTALAEARRAIVETHKELSATQEMMGLRVTAEGGDGDKPPVGYAVEPNRRRLRTVGGSAA